jgi:hypothetical protein
MAFITKQEVQAKSAALKALNKKYGVTAGFSGSNTSKLTLTIRAGKVDFIDSFLRCLENANSANNYNTLAVYKYVKENRTVEVNHYYMDQHFDGEALAYLEEVYALMKEGHFDESDIQSDYFHCAWYNNIRIGSWEKPYELNSK